MEILLFGLRLGVAYVMILAVVWVWFGLIPWLGRKIDPEGYDIALRAASERRFLGHKRKREMEERWGIVAPIAGFFS